MTEKLKQWQIKDLILETLENYPMNSSQLASKIGTNQKTVKRHLEELQDLHKVQQIQIVIRGEPRKRWQIVRL